MPGRPRRLVALSVLVFGAAGCGDDGTSSVSSDELLGRSFVATDVGGRELVSGTEILLGFDEGLVVAEAGCNSMRGGFELVDRRLEVGALAQTMMACEADLQRQDEWLARFLGARPTISVDGSTLTLRSDEVTINASERP